MDSDSDDGYYELAPGEDDITADEITEIASKPAADTEGDAAYLRQDRLFHEVSGECSYCGSEATQCCDICKEFPSYNARNRLQGAYYCSQRCTKKHRRLHEITCRRLYQRIMLEIVGELLETLWLIVMSTTYNREIASVAHTMIGKDEVILVREVDSCPPSFSKIRHLVEEGTSKRNYRITDIYDTHVMGAFFRPALRMEHSLAKAAVFYDSHENALSWLHEIVKELLRGYASRVERIRIVVKNVGTRAVFWYHDESKPTRLKEYAVWKVTLLSGEQWILDLTGAQFGFDNLTIGYETFKRKYINKIIGEGPWQSIETIVNEDATEDENTTQHKEEDAENEREDASEDSNLDEDEDNKGEKENDDDDDDNEKKEETESEGEDEDEVTSAREDYQICLGLYRKHIRQLAKEHIEDIFGCVVQKEHGTKKALLDLHFDARGEAQSDPGRFRRTRRQFALQCGVQLDEVLAKDEELPKLREALETSYAVYEKAKTEAAHGGKMEQQRLEIIDGLASGSVIM